MSRLFMKKKVGLLFGLLLSASTLAGCSLEDLMFWKPKDDQQQQNDDSNKGKQTQAPLYKGMKIKDKEQQSSTRATAESIYVLRKDEDFLFEINFENPDKFEIQSFTINNTKYANYMFESGSTLEKILLKSKAPSEYGEYQFTIDAIKYIDGETIKDVKIEGSKTIKGNVQPYVVHLYANGGTLSQTTIEIDSGDELVLPSPTKQNDEFLGWFDEQGSKVENHTFTENTDLNLTAHYLSSISDATYYNLSNEEQNAISQLLNYYPLAGSAHGPAGTKTITYDAFNCGSFVTLVTQSTLDVDDESYDFSIEWNVDTSSQAFKRFTNETETSKDIELNFPEKGAEEFVLNLSINRVFCGEGFYYKPGYNYDIKTQNTDVYVPNYKISDVYAITDSQKIVNVEGQDVVYPSTYDLIDYEYDGTQYSPNFIPNNPTVLGYEKYHYCTVFGKVIYRAPDGDFLLLADGRNVLEVYGGMTYLLDSTYPALVNDYVKITGNLRSYKANIQLGMVFRIEALSVEERAEITEPEPLEYFTLDEAFLNSLHVDGNACDKQAVILSHGGCLANSLATVTGTLVPGSVVKGTNPVSNINSLTPRDRFSFKLQVGTEQMEIAYDYHVDKTGDLGIFDAIKDALLSETSFTVGGTMRYAGSDFTTLEPGNWTLVPFLPTHIQ